MKPNRPLTDRSKAALLQLARFRYLTRSQLQTLLFLSNPGSEASQEVLTRRALRALAERDLIRSTPRLVGGPAGGSSALVYSVSSSGLRLATSLDPDLIRRTGALQGTFLMQHALAAAEVALAFAKAAVANPGHELLQWECDWETSYRLGAGQLVPDAHLVYATRTTELEALVEVDLGSEGSRFFQAKVGRYLDFYRGGEWRRAFRTWPLVVTITPTERRAQLLCRATETLLAAQPDRARVAVETEFGFASLPNLITKGPLAPIWSIAGRNTQPIALISQPEGGD
jgi:hypothetical protein